MISKIALVNMCYPKDAVLCSPPLGLLSIATFLKQHNIDTQIYDISIDIPRDDFNIETITEYLLSIEEDIIGISIWDSVISKIILSVQRLKDIKSDKIVILGGPTATNLSTSLLEFFPCVDYCVEGEGEYTLYNLLHWIDSKDNDLDKLSNKVVGRVSNVIFRGNNMIPLLSEKQIPSVDYSLCEIKSYTRFEVSSSRGCPFRCDFCSINSTLDNKIRIRPLDIIFKELELLFSCTGTETANFVDDNFGLINSRLKEFCAQFKKSFPNKNWTCYFRLNDLTKDNVDMMAKSGCIGVFIGIETGNKDNLDKIGKGIAIDELISRLKYATQRFDVTASFIWGFPNEDESQLLDTFKVIDRITEFDNIIVDLYQLSPLSGTPLTAKMLPNLVFDEDAISGFIFPPNLPKLSEPEIKLVRQYPDIFSAFYHEDTELFGNKLHLVNKFIGENIWV